LSGWKYMATKVLAMKRTSITKATNTWRALIEPARKPLTVKSLPKPVKPARATSIVAALQADREE